DLGETERTAIRRTIAERCLYGVDLNPMAVQLARLSLWLATLAAERPLTFLDHRLQIGDSLLGAWLANLRLPPDPRRHAAPRRCRSHRRRRAPGAGGRAHARRHRGHPREAAVFSLGARVSGSVLRPGWHPAAQRRL